MHIYRAVALSAVALLVALAMSADQPRAQHSYPPEQVQQGKGLYDLNCGRCHGDDGANVTGVELFKQIRRASADEDIAKLIQNGIPGTSMPPHAITLDQSLSIVAYMRSMVGVDTARNAGAPSAAGTASEVVPAGDASRGRAIFTGSGGCVSCHKAEGKGGASGPDLSRAGEPRGFGPFVRPPDPVALARAILDPNAEISAGFETFQVAPKSGAPVRGTLLNQDTFSVQLRDEAQNLRSFWKTDLQDSGFLPSSMPSYRGRLSPQEVGDVVAYLLTLKEQAR